MLSANWPGLIMPRQVLELAIVPGGGQNHNNGQGGPMRISQPRGAQERAIRIRIKTIIII